MTEVKHLYRALVFMDSVVNQDRAMQELSYARALSDGAAHAREAGEQFDMIQQSIAEASGGLGIVFSNVTDDLSQIV